MLGGGITVSYEFYEQQNIHYIKYAVVDFVFEKNIYLVSFKLYLDFDIIPQPYY